MKPRGMEERPVFDVLPLNPGDPKASAWGLWGKNDELGTINLLTHERTAIAAKEAKLGESISLKYVLPWHPFLLLLSSVFWHDL